ncbi:class I SAM-dependent methyltransferase [uncultured Roseivirga sp.]|uniref:class I SAM-dependent methyltransferase n=1 Tax=uncultured Roseivirga sp. TaxID=543088 RepID=UPI0030DB7F86|tara:strand:- start:706 stop:1353 length:648 start_codon:yes stop_codon:yes gene_type:complete
MKNNTLSKAVKFWDRAASSYDREEKKDEEKYQKTINQLAQYLKSEYLVLDFGCGTGLISNEISPLVQQIHAIDFSHNMIELAKTKAQKHQITNVQYKQSTIFDDYLKPASYDVILCIHVLHLLESAERVVSRIHELLKPEGLIVSVTPCMAEKPFMNGLFSLLYKLGLTPKINPLKAQNLKKLFAEKNFKIIDHHLLPKTSNQHFIVCKKRPLRQ